MYIDKLDNTYIDFKKELNDKHPKLKAGDCVRISNYQNIFAKGYIPNWSDEKVIKRKGDKLYVKWKGYINLFNSSIDKKHLVGLHRTCFKNTSCLATYKNELIFS